MNWGHLQLPGMKFMQPSQPSGARQDKFAIMEPNPPFTTFGHDAQPYVKLHGSANWMESRKAYPHHGWPEGREHRTLSNSEVVPRRVSQDAGQAIGQANVIGYSFSDTHINDAIVDGIAAALRLFVIDPFALKALQNDPVTAKPSLHSSDIPTDH
ncbi:hypothetical protein GPL17_33045 [Bradyrhizobium yuanmingense]|uniref:hypothetical protein n=1 Tax=Bradyrhizobium yuanmingense TaxID=108015 RepID=UPI0012FB697E|nr:hypothetical protein [Bradyrhizobium yuanmingense]MVT55262.1 hypothetical protein [Bradyrhizobium yuanmingense]